MEAIVIRTYWFLALLTIAQAGDGKDLVKSDKPNTLQKETRSGFDDEESPDVLTLFIPPSEHIMANMIPGLESKLICSKEGELYKVWSSMYDCLFCGCFNIHGYLRSICAKCDGCAAQTPDAIATSTSPERASCNPLPSGRLFENPLNPCQVCICLESVDVYGQVDVHINCQDNYECVLPPEAIVSIPDVPFPVPLPTCGLFPGNVDFPHPSDKCKVCHCEVDSEPKISCVTDYSCVPSFVPELQAPDSTGVKPEYDGFPSSWPPVTTPIPLTPQEIVPGPLPGPKPHESCQPFIPDQVFQHPWDECQMCTCSESFSANRITVEVNCYYKRACCFEDDPGVYVSPGPMHYPTQSTASYNDNVMYQGSSGVMDSNAMSLLNHKPNMDVMRPTGGQNIQSDYDILGSIIRQGLTNSVQQPGILYPGLDVYGGAMVPSETLEFSGHPKNVIYPGINFQTDTVSSINGVDQQQKYLVPPGSSALFNTDVMADILNGNQIGYSNAESSAKAIGYKSEGSATAKAKGMTPSMYQLSGYIGNQPFPTNNMIPASSSMTRVQPISNILGLNLQGTKFVSPVIKFKTKSGEDSGMDESYD